MGGQGKSRNSDLNENFEKKRRWDSSECLKAVENLRQDVGIPGAGFLYISDKGLEPLVSAKRESDCEDEIYGILQIAIRSRGNAIGKAV